MRHFSFIILIFISAITLTASDPFFGIPSILNPKINTTNFDSVEKPWMATENFRSILEDKDNRISDEFTISPFFYPNVLFWFLIYTQFDSSSVVIHDKNNLSLIYRVLDFNSLKNKSLPLNTRYILQQKLTSENVSQLKRELAKLTKNPFSISENSQKIYHALRVANVTIPINKRDRVALFRSLKNNIRTQTGQKNFIRDGIVRSLPYQTFLKNYFRQKKLPQELLAIPFLESSFNPRAHSKVDALGIWQFMPFISSSFVPKRSNQYDYRYNVGVSSVAAGFLMAENIKILKSWDLAVTAYNSGTKHLLKTKRELDDPYINLEKVVQNSDSAYFGFASKNFYSEFLALVHTLAYKEELFDNIHQSERPDVQENLRFYLTKCSLKLKKVLSETELENVYFHNHHTTENNEKLPRGFILTTKVPLPKSKFFEVPNSQLLKLRPKDWNKLTRRQSCSTR